MPFREDDRVCDFRDRVPETSPANERTFRDLDLLLLIGTVNAGRPFSNWRGGGGGPNNAG